MPQAGTEPQDPFSRPARHGVVAALTVVSMGVFALGLGRMGSIAGAVALVPALAAGRLLGFTAGLAWGAAACVVLNLVVAVKTHGLWPAEELAVGVASVLITGGLMGRLQDLRLQVARTERQRVLAETRARVATSERLAALGTLAASVAHEVNNPMSYVLANLEFATEALAGRAGEAELRAALDEALHGVQRVQSIITDMRKLSRGSEEALVPVDVPAVVKSALNLASPVMKHSVTLQLELGPVPPVLATEARLGQVVMNLVVNASQAMPARLASANRILVRTRTDEAGRAVIEVHDNGTGIEPDVAPHIFDPFFTTKPSGVGTGLGLSICHSIVGTLGGELTFATELGKGTRFQVLLPPAPQEPATVR